MAVCNIFKQLTKTTGSFLTFSQYMEDLTRWQTESKYYKVVPSKFIALNCDLNGYDDKSFPKYLQDKFENACACFKNSNNIEWSPECSKSLFWNTMFESGFMNPIQTLETDSLPYIQEIKYVGDINIQSYNNVDGMGYSEIYCHIPNEAVAHQYYFVSNELVGIDDLNVKTGNIIQGFIEGELNGDEKISADYTYSLGKSYTFSWDDPRIKTEDLKDTSFNINMIIVLYDVWNDDKLVYTGIPLGLYITGLINNGVIQNPITKYVSNEDIYNSGTSYGLRICSRYAVSPEQDNYIVKDVTIENDDSSNFSQVLSQISISQAKMDEVINKTYNTEQNYKTLLSIFKNSRTNVPYIKIVNNEPCWFVNGKLLNSSFLDIYDSYTYAEMDLLLGKPSISQSDTLQVIFTALNEDGESIFDATGSVAQNIILKWDVYYKGQLINPTSTILKKDDVVLGEYTKVNRLEIDDINETTEFEIIIKFGTLTTSKRAIIHFVHPTYFGELFDIDNIDEIKYLPKYLDYDCEQTHTITTQQTNPGYICYAYPQTFGHLSQIVDQTGFIYYNLNDVIIDDRFTCKELTIDNVEYYAYILSDPSYVVDCTFKFQELKIK